MKEFSPHKQLSKSTIAKIIKNIDREGRESAPLIENERKKVSGHLFQTKVEHNNGISEKRRVERKQEYAHIQKKKRDVPTHHPKLSQVALAS